MGLRRDAIYRLCADGRTFRPYDWALFHRTLHDWDNDLGNDHSGENQWVILSRSVCVPDSSSTLSWPAGVRAVMAKKCHTRGHAIYPFVCRDKHLFPRAVAHLGVDFAEGAFKGGGVLKLYRVPYPAKRLSPCIEGGVCSLFVCCPGIRRSARLTAHAAEHLCNFADNLVDIAGLPQVIVALTAGCVQAAFLVDSVVSVREYLSGQACRHSAVGRADI